MTLEDDILVCTISHWNDEFTGISSSKISERLKIAHGTIRLALREMVGKGLGDLNSVDGNEHDIFFPARVILSEWYYKNVKPYQMPPEYRKRLHLGYSQIKHFYFDSSVLRKYLIRPEVYEVDDSIEGGFIRMRPAFWENAQIQDKDAIAIGNMRFGKRLSSGGNTTVGAILWDLAELPSEDQRYWYGFELERPQFQETDSAFDRYIAQNFDASFVESQDKLHGLLQCIVDINTITLDSIGAALFRQTTNPDLMQPVENTYKAFCDSCSELYKLLGPDSINHVMNPRSWTRKQ